MRGIPACPATHEIAGPSPSRIRACGTPASRRLAVLRLPAFRPRPPHAPTPMCPGRPSRWWQHFLHRVTGTTRPGAHTSRILPRPFHWQGSWVEGMGIGWGRERWAGPPPGEWATGTQIPPQTVFVRKTRAAAERTGGTRGKMAPGRANGLTRGPYETRGPADPTCIGSPADRRASHMYR